MRIVTPIQSIDWLVDRNKSESIYKVQPTFSLNVMVIQKWSNNGSLSLFLSIWSGMLNSFTLSSSGGESQIHSLPG